MNNPGEEKERFQTKKSLGQHFLRNKQILCKAADAISPEIDTIIEIGPGEGTLTELLLERVTGKGAPKDSKVICIEKDHRLIPILEEKFKKQIKAKKLEVLHKDFLEVSEADIKKMTASAKKGRGYAIVGNIPYYITGAIFEKSLESKNPPKELVFLIQKEVADRICARGEYAPHKINGVVGIKESILSISIKVFGNPIYITTVDKGQFAPPPKVDSAIIKIGDISHDLFKKNKVSIEQFFETVKKGFSHKRKVLRSNLGISQSRNTSIPAEELNTRAKTLGDMRAEDLSIDDWMYLTKFLSK